MSDRAQKRPISVFIAVLAVAVSCVALGVLIGILVAGSVRPGPRQAAYDALRQEVASLRREMINTNASYHQLLSALGSPDALQAVGHMDGSDRQPVLIVQRLLRIQHELGEIHRTYFASSSDSSGNRPLGIAEAIVEAKSSVPAADVPDPPKKDDETYAWETYCAHRRGEIADAVTDLGWWVAHPLAGAASGQPESDADGTALRVEPSHTRDLVTLLVVADHARQARAILDALDGELRTVEPEAP